MKKTVMALLSAALLTTLGIMETSAQENDKPETEVEQQRIGQWVITREYSVTRDDEEGISEKKNVSYDISYGHGFSAHLPFYYMGFSGFFQDSPFSMDFHDIGLDEAKSWEWGIYLPMDAVRLGNDHIGLGFAFGFGRTMYKFDTPRYFYTSRSLDVYSSRSLDGEQRFTSYGTLPSAESYDETWFRYWSFKLPVLLEFQTSDDGFFLSVGPELEYRFSPASRGRQYGKRKETITNSISMHPLNVNLLAQVGFNNVSIMAKTSLVGLLSNPGLIMGNLPAPDTLPTQKNSAQVWPVSVCLGLTF